MANIIFGTGDLKLKSIEQNDERYPEQFDFILENGISLTIWVKGELVRGLKKLAVKGFELQFKKGLE